MIAFSDVGDRTRGWQASATGAWLIWFNLTITSKPNQQDHWQHWKRLWEGAHMTKATSYHML